MLALPPCDPSLPAHGQLVSSFALRERPFEPAGFSHDRLTRLLAFRREPKNLLSADAFPEDDDKQPIDVAKMNAKRRKKSISVMRTQDLYEVLNIYEDRTTVSEESIKKNYKQLALLYHPDKHEDGKYDAVAKEQWLKVSSADPGGLRDAH